MIESFRLALESGEPNSFEFHWPNGRISEIRHVPEKDSDGRVAGVLLFGRDITERRNFETALLKREREYLSLAENSPDVIVRFDAKGRIVYANAAGARTLERDAEFLRGKTLVEILPRDDRAAVRCNEQIFSVLTTGEANTLELMPETRACRGEIHRLSLIAERNPGGEVVGVLVIGRDITQLREHAQRAEESRDELRKLNVRLAGAREEERKRIAREIHDELGQMLTAQRLELAMLKFQSGGKDATLAQRLGHLVDLTDKTIQIVRDIAYRLRPAALDVGIIPALESLARDFTERSGTRCQFFIFDSELAPDEAQSTALYRITQESLTNVARHANAQSADIVLQQDNDNISLSIRDDGQGFDTEHVPANTFGLVGIRERALEMEGEACIISAPDCGTTILIRMPRERKGKVKHD